jgi:hypothetical protein
MKDNLKILREIEKGKLTVDQALDKMNETEGDKEYIFQRKNYLLLIWVKIGWFPLFLILPTFLEGIIYPVLKRVSKETNIEYNTLKGYVKSFRNYGSGTLCHVTVKTPDLSSSINVHLSLI